MADGARGKRTRWLVSCGGLMMLLVITAPMLRPARCGVDGEKGGRMVFAGDIPARS